MQPCAIGGRVRRECCGQGLEFCMTRTICRNRRSCVPVLALWSRFTLRRCGLKSHNGKVFMHNYASIFVDGNFSCNPSLDYRSNAKIALARRLRDFLPRNILTPYCVTQWFRELEPVLFASPHCWRNFARASCPVACMFHDLLSPAVG